MSGRPCIQGETSREMAVCSGNLVFLAGKRGNTKLLRGGDFPVEKFQLKAVLRNPHSFELTPMPGIRRV